MTREIADCYSATQSLSIENGKLTAVTLVSAADAPVTMTYARQ